MEDAITKLTKLLRSLVGSSFFGKLVIGFQNGKVTTIIVEQVKKLDEL